MVKKIFFFYFIINLFNYLYANPYKIIVTINNNPITQIDLDNEVKILSILNKKKSSEIGKSNAIDNLIEEIIKSEEIQKEKLSMDDNLINQNFNQLLKNLNLNEDTINQNLILLIKKKIEVDSLWNNLINRKYGWKININIKEIDMQLKKKYSNDMKENLVFREKNKKLAVFSRYHLNKLKEESLIKFYK